jgi:hypothetical protein
MLDTQPISTASLSRQAAIAFVAPTATRWMYATPERVGVLVDEPNGSHRIISGDELNRAYALMADAEPGTIAADAAALARPGNLSAEGFRTEDGFEVRTWRVGQSQGGGWRFEVRTDAAVIATGWSHGRSDVTNRVAYVLGNARA